MLDTEQEDPFEVSQEQLDKDTTIIDEHMQREQDNPLYKEEVLAKQIPSTLRAWFLSIEQHKAGLYSSLVRTQDRVDELVLENAELHRMLSVPLSDGSILKIGDTFTVKDTYPFFTEDLENYNAEMYWDDEQKRLSYGLYIVSHRVMGRAIGGCMSNLDWSLIERREKIEK